MNIKKKQHKEQWAEEGWALEDECAALIAQHVWKRNSPLWTVEGGNSGGLMGSWWYVLEE